MFLELDEGSQEAALPDLAEQPPEVILEQDHEDDGPDALESGHEPVQGVELEPARDEPDNDDYEERRQHLHRASSSEQEEQVVHDERDDRYVDKVEDDSPA